MGADNSGEAELSRGSMAQGKAGQVSKTTKHLWPPPSHHYFLGTHINHQRKMKILLSKHQGLSSTQEIFSFFQRGVRTGRKIIYWATVRQLDQEKMVEDITHTGRHKQPPFFWFYFSSKPVLYATCGHQFRATTL